jgi:iron complex transport system ATP-binding protein
MIDPILNIEQINYAYTQGDWRLGGVSLAVRPGEMIGVIGPNGSGKSTLLKIAAAILTPSAGQVMLAGQNIHRLSRRDVARQLGYLPQSTVSFFDFRVEEVVAMGRFCHSSGLGFLQPGDHQIVEHCLALTETAGHRDRRLSQLSGGERQRVMLASVLAQQPRLLLLDEPTTGLDMHHQVSFFNVLADLVAGGLAVAVVTHDLNMAALYCNRLMLLRDGRIFREGPVDDVIRPDVMAEIYHHCVYIDRHRTVNRPVILPMPTFKNPSPADRPDYPCDMT